MPPAFLRYAPLGPQDGTQWHGAGWYTDIVIF
nr:MAG TPA: hypothetical protein [Caudoviricetes sp.]